ncbi:MAG: IS200/IS605 family transposase [Cyclobacteriaceae bacterium]|nr:IS200/IS605 family transposase [Cyclobacteriaceae bacterium]
MSHSLPRIWVHAISGTKDRLPLINLNQEKKIYQHLEEQLIELNCPVKIINGMPDHVHLLFKQNPNISVEDTLKQIKGNTSYWINHNDVLTEKFAWQTGYGAFSVSESQLEKVTAYILNQKMHHKQMTFKEEYEAFLKFNGFKLDGDTFK